MAQNTPSTCFATPTLLHHVRLHTQAVTCVRSGQQHTLTVASASPSPRSCRGSPSLSRRAVATLLASMPVLPFLPSAARADGMLSQMVLYRDLPKGFVIYRPNGWNEFEGLQDNYDIKWQDVIQPLEFITVLTNPVSKEKRLSDLGDAQAVGAKLAKSRSGELVDADVKDLDGVPAYVIEIKRAQSRQITLLAINKMKLYSVNASCPERRWSKREKLLRAAVGSFKPRL